MQDAPQDRIGRVRAIAGGEGALGVVEWGQQRHPPVILLHGLRGYARWFEEVAQKIASEHLVVSCDLRGRGNSSNSPTGDYRVDVLVDDLEDVVDAYGERPVVLVGHSLGGLVALMYTGRHPERVKRLVLLDAGTEVDPRGLDRIRGELLTTPGSFNSWESAVEFVERLHPTSSDQRASNRQDGMLRRGPDGTVSWRIDQAVFRSNAVEPPWRTWRALKRITCPTLVMRGSHSDIVTAQNAEEMLAQLPEGSKTAEVPGAGHMVLDDAPELATDIIVEFVEVPAGASDGRTATGSGADGLPPD